MDKVSVSLHLDKPKTEPTEKQKETYILYSVSVSGNRFRISTGFKVKPKDFDLGNYKIKPTVEGYSTKNSLISQRKAEIEEVCNQALYQKIPVTKDYLLSNLSFTGTPEKQNSFYQSLDKYIQFREGDVKKSVLNKYKYLKKTLTEFATEKKTAISFDSINENFEKDFKAYLYAKGLSDNGLTSYFSKLKAFMRWANERGITKNEKYKKFKVPSHEPLIHPLTINELKAFEKVKATGNKDLVKDIFLFQCYTGLRISDVMDLRPANIKGNTIRDFTKKTKEQIFVPLIKRSVSIIKKYSLQAKDTGFVFPRLSTDKIRKHLKELGKAAGLTENISKEIFKGTERENKTMPRYEALGTHDGRRTFITLSLTKGMNAQMLMRITGHQKLENLERYIRFTDTDIQDTLNFVWKKI